MMGKCSIRQNALKIVWLFFAVLPAAGSKLSFGHDVSYDMGFKFATHETGCNGQGPALIGAARIAIKSVYSKV